jgi:diguanylate cyclase (GGDEF)-like protein
VPLLVVAGAALLVTVVVLPIGGRQLGPTVSFVPALLSVVACFDIMSAYLLVGDYRDQGELRLLVMACAYAWSLTVMAGYALAFPGVVSSKPPLALVPSLAAYFYLAWHSGFPILLGAAWAPWPLSWTLPTPVGRRRAIALVVMSGTAAAGIAVVAILALLAHHLPVLIKGLDTSRMTTLTAPLALPLVLVALLATLWGTRARTGPERWSSVAVLVCFLDLLLTYSSKTRYSLGWYTGRSLTLLSAGVVLVAMLATFRRLKAEAEHNAVFDALTGLLNRRGAYTTLDQLIARAHRSGAPLGMVSFDLDHFKQVNDRHGHEAGDNILSEVGHLMTSLGRQGDVVARVGGEEFLALLPDTDLDGATGFAERIRKLIAAMAVPPKTPPSMTPKRTAETES